MQLFSDILSFLLQIPPNADFTRMDSDKVTTQFHTLLFEIVHQVCSPKIVMQ